MVLKCDVLGRAVDHAIEAQPNAPILAMTPRGNPITQARIREIASGPGVTLICGRFEGGFVATMDLSDSRLGRILERLEWYKNHRIAQQGQIIAPQMLCHRSQEQPPKMGFIHVLKDGA